MFFRPEVIKTTSQQQLRPAFLSSRLTFLLVDFAILIFQVNSVSTNCVISRKFSLEFLSQANLCLCLQKKPFPISVNVQWVRTCYNGTIFFFTKLQNILSHTKLRFQCEYLVNIIGNVVL